VGEHIGDTAKCADPEDAYDQPIDPGATRAHTVIWAKGQNTRHESTAHDPSVPLDYYSPKTLMYHGANRYMTNINFFD
jgi:hypothetical protein